MEKTVFGHFICTACDKVVDRYYLEDHGDRYTGPQPTEICPVCGSENTLVEAEICMCCTTGWKKKTEGACEKCQKRLRGSIRLFLRNFNKHERAYYDELLDGNSVEDLV